MNKEPEIKEFVEHHYQLEVRTIAPLEGYDGVNYKIEAATGNFILKFTDPAAEPNTKELLEAENQLLRLLAANDHKAFPIPQKNARGELLSFAEDRGHFFRLLTFVEGELLSRVEQTPEVLYSFGKFVAEMDKAILDFRHIATEARKFEWDIQNLSLNEKYLKFIESPRDRSLVEYFLLQYAENVLPAIDTLRKSVIHGDANDWNILVDKNRVSGIIDFGDISYSPLVNELAIAVTYGIFGKDDFVEAAKVIIKGYCDVLPLNETEIGLIYYLVAARTSISVLQAARAKSEGRDSEYVFISSEPAWDLLRRWLRVNPVFFEEEIRKEVGFESKIEPAKGDTLAKRREHTSNALSLQFDKPIKMVGAAFQYMYDSRGNTYLDCYNNVPQVGHCHPRVVKAGQRGMARLNTNTRYLNDVYNRYAKNLLARFPEPLNKVFFVNSGSAAADLAIRLALNFSENRGIAVMEHGYHGNTRLGIEISHYKYNRKGGAGKSRRVIELELPDSYKGRFSGDDAGGRFAAAAIEKIAAQGSAPAAFVAEPIVGCGGQVPLAAGYLKALYPFIRENGGVCVTDEVQTGFGRLGKHFWGFELHGVVPDIVVLGKPIANGHPMGAVVTTDEIASSFETGMEFFSSFGGNPVSCLIGQSVLDVLEEENLPENAKEVGNYLQGLLEGLVEKHDVCGDARGEGLFLGLELVKGGEAKSPAQQLAADVQNQLKDRGILVGTDGPDENVIKIKPPICFTRENADELVSNLDAILSA